MNVSNPELPLEPHPLVSVIIPCYNYAQFLPSAVASVLAQHYKNWELIIVDDGSQDTTLQVARQLQANCPAAGLRLFQQPNSGLSAARNTGALNARGELLLFLDADDMLAPDYLAQAVPVLSRQAQVGFVYAGLQLFGDDWHSWPACPFAVQTLKLLNYVPPHALVRRRLWEEIGGFDTLRFPRGVEDWEFWLRAAAAGWLGYWIDAPLIYYRRHGASMTRRFRPSILQDAQAQIIRKNPTLYSPRLYAWATRRCARRALPDLSTAAPLVPPGVLELPAPAVARADPPVLQLPQPPARLELPLGRRLLRAIPFVLRIRVQWMLRRVQFALYASGLWC